NNYGQLASPTRSEHAQFRPHRPSEQTHQRTGQASPLPSGTIRPWHSVSSPSDMGSGYFRNSNGNISTIN
ncbi:hypothetical protein ACLOJK_035054, partial [Asimina triloba]